jgi:excisionase family DNA binding protein
MSIRHVADVDQDKQEVVLLIHWVGGRHSELRVKKNGLGKHRRCTGVEAVEVVRQMSGKYPDEEIAATLNRLGLRTGTGNSWSTQRVYALRHYHELPNNKVNHSQAGVVTMQEAAHRLGVSTSSVRRMIELKVIPAVQAVECAPWEIREEALQTEAVQKAANNTKNRIRPPRTRDDEGQSLLFSES